MKKLLLLITFLALSVLTACSANQLDEAPATEGTTMEVPAPGHEDVEEMVVSADESTSEESESEPAPEEPVDESVESEPEQPTSEESESEPAPEEPVDEFVEPEAAAPVVRDISVTATKWEFTPSVITVNEGDTVNLTLTNTDVSHGIFIPAFNVNLQVGAGESASTSFVASKAGSYTFSCSVACGSGHGKMKGTLVVQ